MPKLFFSGTQHEILDTDPRIPRDETWYRLGSCHEAFIKPALSRAEMTVTSTGGNCELLFDSGAFTAWSKGREVDFDHLCSIYDKVLEMFVSRVNAVWLINLDKIPGQKGRDGTPQELVEAMEISNRNFEKMEERFGHHVIPVFHQDEPVEQLERLLVSPFICLSPRNDLPEHKRIAWSVSMHAVVNGRSRTHGLAATGMRMMRFVPWSTVDSAAWIFCASNGGIIMPDGSIIPISNQSPAMKTFGKHYRSVPAMHRKRLNEIIADAGFTIEQLENNAAQRMVFNRISFMRLAARPYDDIKVKNDAGLFDI